LAWNFKGKAGERQLIRFFFILSLVVHLICLLVNVPRFFFPSDHFVPEQEWAIEADLISDIPQPAKKSGKTADLDAPAAAPPKLPDIAAVKKAPAPKEEAIPLDPVEKPEKTPKKPEPPPEKLAKEQDKKPPQEEDFKAKLFDKMLREQKQQQDKLKLDTRQEEKKNAALAKKLSQLRKSIGTGSDDEDAPGGADYGQVISSYIKKNYQIPDAYNYQGVVAPTVSFSISAAGELMGLKIIRSSNHAAVDHYVLQSIQDAANSFPKPPADFVGREINVHFTLP
jgi:TonB family protein